MDQDHLPYLLSLYREQDWARAAKACNVSERELRKRLRAAEQDYGRALIDKNDAPIPSFTDEGLSVVAWAQNFSEAVASLKRNFAASRKRALLTPLLARRSVSPKRLDLPGPEADELDLMIRAALSAPDHGGLHPWRILVFAQHQREALAELFEQEKLRRDPLAPREDLMRAREHATRSPALLAFIVSPKARMRVPKREQVLAAGAALGNLLNAAHQLGYGAIVLSGERCFDATLAEQLGLAPAEYLAGFVSLGSIAAPPPPRKPVPLDAVRKHWDQEDGTAEEASSAGASLQNARNR